MLQNESEAYEPILNKGFLSLGNFNFVKVNRMAAPGLSNRSVYFNITVLKSMANKK